MITKVTITGADDSILPMFGKKGEEVSKEHKHLDWSKVTIPSLKNLVWRLDREVWAKVEAHEATTSWGREQSGILILEFLNGIKDSYLKLLVSKDPQSEIESLKKDYEWINIKDRLPETGKHVLIAWPSFESFATKSNGYVVRSGSFNGHGKGGLMWSESSDSHSFYNGVEYWMPLPGVNICKLSPKEDTSNTKLS